MTKTNRFWGASLTSNRRPNLSEAASPEGDALRRPRPCDPPHEHFCDNRHSNIKSAPPRCRPFGSLNRSRQREGSMSQVTFAANGPYRVYELDLPLHIPSSGVG